MFRFQKKLTLFIILSGAGLIFGLFTPDTYFDKENSHQYFRQGIQLYHDYQYEASIDFFLKSLSSNPRHYKARKMLGQSYYFSGDIDKAVQEWNAIFRYGGEDPFTKQHIQNLSSVNIKSELSRHFTYFEALNATTGFKYQFPLFILSLPNQNKLVLAQDGADNGIILEVNSDGKFIYNMRRISGKLELPIAASLNQTQIWVVDYGSDTIHRLEWSKLGKQFPLIYSLDKLGSAGSGEMQFRGPTGICYLNGFHFIVDNGNHRVQKIDVNGKFNLLFNETETNNYLHKPFGITCGQKSGKIYVSEVEQARISIFDEYGNFEKYMGEGFLKKPRHIHLSPDETRLVIADEKEGVFIFHLEKNSFYQIKEYDRGEEDIRSLVRPYSAVLDQNQNLFIADYSAHSILHFLPEEYRLKNVEVWAEKIDNKQFPTVALWVSVKDHNNKYLNGLSESNFTIIENGATIRSLRTDYTRQFKAQISVVLLISRNEKMKQYSAHSSLWASDFILRNLRQNDSVKLVSYDKDYRDETPWTNSRLRLRQGIRQSLPVNTDDDSHGSSVEKALYYSASKLLRKRGKKALIWLHEGEFINDELSPIGFQKISNYLKINHIPLYIISFENPKIIDVLHKKKSLEELSSYTNGRYYYAYSSELQNIRSAIHDQQDENLVVYYNSEANEKWKKQYMDIKIIVNFQGRTGSETTGYFIP